MAPTQPDPPTSLPKYLREGLPKQDDADLQAIQAYIDRLLAHRDEVRSLARDDLPDSAAPLTKTTFKGHTWWIVEEGVKCGDESCRCMRENERHGPYKYAYRRDADGELVKEYVDDKPHLLK